MQVSQASYQKFLDDAVVFAKSDTGMITLGVVALVYLLAFCRICSRVGFSPFLGLVFLLPPFTFLLPLALGFWPSPKQRELRVLRSMQKSVQRADQRLAS